MSTVQKYPRPHRWCLFRAYFSPTNLTYIPDVSVCRLGCAAVFLIGGLTRDDPPTPILLRSGDVVVMSGPVCRRAYHGAFNALTFVTLVSR